MSKKRNDKESMICLTLKPSQSLFAYHTHTKKKNLIKKSFLGKRRSEGLNRKWKDGFLTALTLAVKEDPTTSIRKHNNELKVHEKTVTTAIKQD